MVILLDMQTQTELARWDTQPTGAIGGPWGEWLASGRAVWVPVPPGEDIRDCDVVTTPPPVRLVVNAARKAARLAKENDISALKQRLAEYDDDTATPAQQKQFRKDIKRVIVALARSLKEE